MTTSTTEHSDRRQWWRIFGPWPLYPFAAMLSLSVVSFVSQAYQFTPFGSIPTVINALLFGLAAGAILWLAARFAPGMVATWWGYYIVLLVAVTAAALTRAVQGSLLEYEGTSSFTEIAISIFRSFVLVLTVQILMGLSQDRLRRQVAATEKALNAVERQSSALLKADERIRQSVATVLHDRVQAGLLAACLRLQLIRDTATEVSPGELDRVINDLEALRSIDVRRAVRALSPNLQDLDLQTALDDLADAYRPAIDVEVSVAPGCTPDPQARLAAYRIAEQALMNAVAHGEAGNVWISVDRVNNAAEVTITDDGRGVVDEATAGFGTTLIDTWCRTLGATWVRTPRPEGGTVVTARIPQRRATDEIGAARQP